MHNTRIIRKGDIVARFQGKEIIDLGIVVEVLRKNGSETGWMKVYWNGLRKIEITFKSRIKNVGRND